MIDRANIRVIAGSGGDGAISGRREKYVPAGGPDGGDGGDGGSVSLVADSGVGTLLKFRYRREFAASPGSKGSRAGKHGRNGEDVEITVPVGTQVWNDRGGGLLVADLTAHGQSVVVARGGRGGRGNARFATSTLRFPLLAEEGERGERTELRLELKLLADVGIVGAPNAGKSSLLAAVTAARPKVASYPFTTLEPVLGVVADRGEEFVMVDIPGLIEGAHAGVGLGHDFLRHIERTRVLVHMVDGSDDDPALVMDRVAGELGKFAGSLLERPRIVAVNKIDIPGARERVGSIRRRLSAEGIRVHGVSAATREGVDALMGDVLRTLQEERERRAGSPCEVTVRGEPVEPLTGTEGPSQEKIPVLRPRPRRERVRVRRRNGAYVVDAPAAARVAGMVDVGDWNAMTQFHAYLRRVGVVRALEDAGAGPGDTVIVGRLEMEWG